MVDTYKVNDTIYRCIQYHYDYFLGRDWLTLSEVEKLFKEKLNLELSVVKRHDGGWNCFVTKVSYPYEIYTQKIVFQDAWSSEFTYEEVMDNLIFYYFVKLGYIRLPRVKDNKKYDCTLKHMN